MEALGGVEPPTNSLGNCCSIHLSYRAVRGLDLGHFSLSQLGLASRVRLLPNCCPIPGQHFPASLPPLCHPPEQSLPRSNRSPEGVPLQRRFPVWLGNNCATPDVANLESNT